MEGDKLLTFRNQVWAIVTTNSQPTYRPIQSGIGRLASQDPEGGAVGSNIFSAQDPNFAKSLAPTGSRMAFIQKFKTWMNISWSAAFLEPIIASLLAVGVDLLRKRGRVNRLRSHFCSKMTGWSASASSPSCSNAAFLMLRKWRKRQNLAVECSEAWNESNEIRFLFSNQPAELLAWRKK